jgi:hypothetical protein
MNPTKFALLPLLRFAAPAGVGKRRPYNIRLNLN